MSKAQEDVLYITLAIAEAPCHFPQATQKLPAYTSCDLKYNYQRKRLMAFVLLMAAPWEVTCEEQVDRLYFGCHRNVDALCSIGARFEQQVRE
ncbi:hypothetical protein H4Q26_004191 [Puccinia striiformis f. sp. tritici PST-130]|nr:hypothetical protein H4Q26_004191 [Puccinia striiformis f. sp. tritici PST-130]